MANEFKVKNGLIVTGNTNVSGTLYASSKSFRIPHPTKPDIFLVYGSLEGPENGVYIRGRLTGTVIELPDYWPYLVDLSSVTVQLTSIGRPQNLYVELVQDNKVYLGGSGEIDCYFTVYAERIDIEKIQVETE